MTSNTPSTLLHALLLDRKGAATALPPGDIADWQPADGLLWLHVDVGEEPPREWLQETIGLDPVVVEVTELVPADVLAALRREGVEEPG